MTSLSRHWVAWGKLRQKEVNPRLESSFGWNLSLSRLTCKSVILNTLLKCPVYNFLSNPFCWEKEEEAPFSANCIPPHRKQRFILLKASSPTANEIKAKGKPLTRFRNGECVILVLRNGLCGILARTRPLCLINVSTVKQESCCTLEEPWLTLLPLMDVTNLSHFSSSPLMETGAQLTCPVSLSMRFLTSSEHYADLSWILVWEEPDFCRLP